jgi:hypothetical protein
LDGAEGVRRERALQHCLRLLANNPVGKPVHDLPLAARWEYA